MLSNNPIFRNIQNNESGVIIKRKDIDKLSLYLSFLMLIPFILSYIFYNERINDYIIITMIFILLFLCILLFFFISKIRQKLITSLAFSLFLGLFLGLTSIFLKKYLYVLNYKKISIINSDSYVFVTIAISLITPIFVVLLYYLLFDYVRSFYYNYIFTGLFSLFLSFIIIFYISQNVSEYNFVINFLVSFLTIAFMTFLQVFYQETIRIIIETPIKKEEIYALALSPLTLVFYFPFEILYILTYKVKKDN